MIWCSCWWNMMVMEWESEWESGGVSYPHCWIGRSCCGSMLRLLGFCLHYGGGVFRYSDRAPQLCVFVKLFVDWRLRAQFIKTCFWWLGIWFLPPCQHPFPLSQTLVYRCRLVLRLAPQLALQSYFLQLCRHTLACLCKLAFKCKMVFQSFL